jgi:hypothetical protein
MKMLYNHLTRFWLDEQQLRSHISFPWHRLD